MAVAATTCMRWLTTTSRKRADGVVEVAAVLDAEALGHRDLDAGEVVPVPHRLEHGVGEPEVEELLEAHLPEEVVDPVDLRLVEVLVELVRRATGRGLVVTERLLDDHAGLVGETGLGEALDDGAEQERWDLQVEDRLLGALDRRADLLVGGGVGEVALHVGEPGREAVEHLGIERPRRSPRSRRGPARGAGPRSRRRRRPRRSGTSAARAARGGTAIGTSSPWPGRP